MPAFGTADSLSFYATLRLAQMPIAHQNILRLLVFQQPIAPCAGLLEQIMRIKYLGWTEPCPSVRNGLCVALAMAIAFTLSQTPARANNYNESLAWQFKTAADRANQAIILDLLAKHRSSYYAAPIYNTAIAQQNVCSVTATSTGNAGTQSALAQSPSVQGATADATGNATDAVSDRSGVSTSDQVNSGAVSAHLNGSTNTTVHGSAWQALNSTQSNTGSQAASVDHSAACAFGTIDR